MGLTRNGQVPQGIPTSTLIANLVFRPTLDLILEYHIKFTIYVDDVTLSSARDFKHLVPEFLAILKRSGFRISHDKTFYKTKNLTVTGVVVHQTPTYI